LESGGGGKPLGTPPGGGEEGAVNVMWRSFIQKIDDEEDFIWNLECEEGAFHRGGAREIWVLEKRERARVRRGELYLENLHARRRRLRRRSRVGMHAWHGVEA